MFIDVCFPNNNEEKYVEIVKKLSTPGVCFVHEDKSKFKKIAGKEIVTCSGLLVKNNTKKTYNEILFSNKITRNLPNTILFYETNDSPSFHAPLKSINQVIIKEIKEKGLCFGLSFSQILKSKHNPLAIEQLKFIITLCSKYDVNLFVASFARTPYQLKSRKQLESVLLTLGLNKKMLGTCFENLHDHIRQIL